MEYNRTMNEDNLLITEYKRFADSFWKNEEIGEKRLHFYLSLTTAVVAGIVALITSKTPGIHYEVKKAIISSALFCLFLFGLVTFFRMVQRNKVADEYKRIIDYVRSRLQKMIPELSDYSLPFQSEKRWTFHGGLAETAALLNSLSLAAITTVWITTNWMWSLTPVLFLLSFVPQVLHATNMRKPQKMAQTFRAGVGAVILNAKREVLALKRKSRPGGWQLPQGGLEVGETPKKAVFREIAEETGIEKNKLRILPVASPLMAYELPKMYRSKKTGRGQVHRWFFLSFQGSNSAITLGDKKEFRDWKWTSLDELSLETAQFKRAIYAKLAIKLRDPRLESYFSAKRS